ncbi:unnamed protein product [marine sediment metagenome]|uniref:Uncharacterized protein n=1 Tax=marine sediment metagenome TaxID=412755 RepID=X1Q1H6_9ZZZZ
MLNLDDYAKLVEGKTCPRCGEKLPPKIGHRLDPKHGFDVEGFPARLMLYVTCSKCGYVWELVELLGEVVGKLGGSEETSGEKKVYGG